MWRASGMHAQARTLIVASTFSLQSASLRYATQLHEMLMALAGDAETEVRCALGAALSSVAGHLGRERCVQFLRKCARPPRSEQHAKVAQGRARIEPVMTGVQASLLT